MNEGVRDEKEAAEPTTKKLSGKKLGVIGAVATVILALVIGISIYNSPTNRLSRQLDLGHKYLIEQNYEQAIVEFDKAIQIDPMSAEAYLGKAEAYVSLGDYDSAIETLERGYEETDGDEEIKEQLVENYLITAENKVKKAAFEESLKDFDRLLKLDKKNKKVIEKLCDCLDQYIDVLMSEKRYDVIKALIEKYKDIAVNLDFDAILQKMQEAIEYDEFLSEAEELVVQIAKLCQAEDYTNVFSLMSEERYDSLTGRLFQIKNEKHIFDTAYGRIGIYKIESEKYGNYMIYYGDFTGDIREGAGVWIGYYEGNNYIAKGSFYKNLPEGEFEIREWNSVLSEKVVYRVITGNVEHGLWNGSVLWCFEEVDGSTHSFPVTFEKGYWVILRYEQDGDAVLCESELEGDSKLILNSEEGGANERSRGIVGFAEDG